MGLYKRWLEDVSVAMGLDGEITPAVMREGRRRCRRMDVMLRAVRAGIAIEEFKRLEDDARCALLEGAYHEGRSSTVSWSSGRRSPTSSLRRGSRTLCTRRWSSCRKAERCRRRWRRSREESDGEEDRADHDARGQRDDHADER